MKRILLIITLLWCISANGQEQLYNRLSGTKGIVKIEKLESDKFSEKYLCWVRQMVCPTDSMTDYFNQRVIVMHRGFDRPTVLITEGYYGEYGLRPGYINELSNLFNTNIVLVEHRFFGPSTPNPKEWQYMKGEFAAADLHHVRELLNDIYPGKWIATGASKGGQNSMIYTMFYPKDVDVTVNYVGPLCRKVEDGRHEPFLSKTVGSPAQRKALYDFQMRLLKGRDSIQPYFIEYCKEKSLTFNMSIDKIYDFAVLEFPFAFWQYGRSFDKIPGVGASAKEIVDYMIKINDPSYFSKESRTLSFHVQAAKELGYYGYDVKPFKKYMHIKTAKGYMAKLMLPESEKFRFDKKLSKMLEAFTKKTNNHLVFIYGEWDPWTAVAFPNPNKKSALYLVLPGGCHNTQIRSFEPAVRDNAIQTINDWLK